MTRFTRWLVDSGHRVRLFGGDNKFDGDVAEQIVADLRRYRPDLEPSCVHRRMRLFLCGTYSADGTLPA